MNPMIKKTIFILLLPLGMFLTSILSFYPEIVETFYSNGIYKLFSQFLSRLTGTFSFSMAEFIIVLLILYLIWYFINIIRKIIMKSTKTKDILISFIINIIIFISMSYFIFIAIWGLNYHRVTFDKIANFDTNPYTTKELENVCVLLIQHANSLRDKVKENAQGVMIINDNLYETFEKAFLGYNIAASKYTELAGNYGRPKRVFFSKVMSYMGISGIYFPFTGEANINIDIPEPLLPATICHEMAHQRGFAREDEANYIGYLTCMLNPNVEFQYSGLLLALTNTMNELYNRNRYKFEQLTKRYSNGVKRDLSYIREYWQQYKGPIEKTHSKLNDAYLKSNRQRDGIQSYNKMVNLLIGEFRKELER